MKGEGHSGPVSESYMDHRFKSLKSQIHILSSLNQSNAHMAVCFNRSVHADLKTNLCDATLLYFARQLDLQDHASENQAR